MNKRIIYYIKAGHKSPGSCKAAAGRVAKRLLDGLSRIE
jgi:hypothetical protein